MNKAEELLENIETFKAEAWAKRYDRSGEELESAKMIKSLHDFSLTTTTKVTLSYSKASADKPWLCTFSVGHGSPDEYKPTLLLVARALSGKEEYPKPKVGAYCTLFQFSVPSLDKDPSELN